MRVSFRLVYDVLILFGWILFMNASILVILVTDQLYFKTFALFVVILLSVLGAFWLIVITMALIFVLTVRLGFHQSISCGTEITTKFERMFMSCDFDEWEVQKLRLSKRMQRDLVKICFLVDVFKVKEDMTRVSRFLHFWKLVRIRSDLIIKAMNEVEWDYKQLSAQNYLNVVEALRQLDNILRTYQYLDEKFEFLRGKIIIERHRREFQTLFNDAVIPEDKKQTFVFQSMSKSLTEFEENLKEKLTK